MIVDRYLGLYTLNPVFRCFVQEILSFNIMYNNANVATMQQWKQQPILALTGAQEVTLSVCLSVHW